MLKYLNAVYLRQLFRTNVLSIFINPFYFYRNGLYKGIKISAPQLHGRILDFGCGSKPYKSLFTNATEYIGVDIDNPGHDHSKEQIDIYYDGNTVPVESETFDAVFCSEVLEHVPNIVHSYSEIKRVLKPKGLLLITVPFVWNEHELPHDYRRFTKGGLENQLIENGFEIMQTQKVSNFLGAIFQMWCMYIYSFIEKQNKYIRMLFTFILIFPFTLIGIIFQLIFPSKMGLYLGTIILARKK